jgi:biotin transport system substrate-specific component
MKSSYLKGLIALALICIIAPLKFSVLGIPFVLQSLVIFTAAGVIGIVPGMIVSLVYLILGAAGVPVFAGFQSGLDKLTGPTAGFLWSFPLIAAYIAWQVRAGEQSTFHYMIYFFRAHLLWLIPGFLVLYLNYEGLDFLSTLVKLMPDILMKSLVGGVITYYLAQKIPPV